MARPHIEPYVEFNEDYRAFDFAGYGGAEYKVLSLDVDTGASSLKVKFNGGYTRKPGLCYSDMEVFVLNGEIKLAAKPGLKVTTLSFRLGWRWVQWRSRKVPKPLFGIMIANRRLKKPTGTTRWHSRKASFR